MGGGVEYEEVVAEGGVGRGEVDSNGNNANP